MPDYEKLPTRAVGGLVHVVVETPRGARAKFKYDPELKVFAFSRTLVLGLTYPYDWGFIPSTRGEDGDPIDAMILHEAATAPGMVVRCRPIAILNVLQSEKGKEERRNDRILAVPAEGGHRTPWNDIVDVDVGLKDELQRFFIASVALQDKTLRFLGWGGAEEAQAAINDHLVTD
jgi:inorganic pyrophosphatase